MTTAQYLYTGICPQQGELLQLPRTLEVEAIARELMVQMSQDELYQREGKMYGVLLVESSQGERSVLRAFSGLLAGTATIAGWVPPIPGRERVAAAEAETLADLAALKQELIALDRSPIRAQYQQLTAEFTERLDRLAQSHRQRQQARQQLRTEYIAALSPSAATAALAQLAAQSRQDGRERRQLKLERDAVLQPLQAILDRDTARIRELKQQRKTRSQQLQLQMENAYQLMNFLGTSASLRSLMPAGIPTGTGECCAPKLLHYAATHRLKPLAMAEFWWGAANGDKRQGEFYGACAERCQPLMGFMLSGTATPQVELVPIIYQDEYTIAVNKPAGLLAVPGRYLDGQDSVLSRLRRCLPDDEIATVHRLDRDTSGILLLARDRQTHRHLTQQFQARQVQKVYEAILAGLLPSAAGTIDLPLWGDPNNRPYQTVDFQHGKPSLTQFQVINRDLSTTRLELQPITGRTHQLRIHLADPRGLGIPILGDRLYGCQSGDRLHLHARELSFIHPVSGKSIELKTATPF